MDKFGLNIKERDFYFNKDHVHINHGSYGAVPKPVMEERLRLIAEIERNPDIFFRWIAIQKWRDNIKVAASFVGANPKNLVFVSNATTGCNAVIKSLKYEKGDALLINSYTYNAIHNICKNTMEVNGGEIIVAEIPLELKDKETILTSYRQKLESHPNIKLVILDLISSCSAIHYPMKELIALCKQYGKLVLIDGAHAPGQVQLDLENMGADFFTGNLHKWVYAPRGCALLWIHPDFHDVITPAMTSHGYKMGSIEVEFFNQGTLDLSPYLSASKAIEYHQNLGGVDGINRYCTDLLEKAEELLTNAWKTPRFPIHTQLKAPHLRLVGLPPLKNFNQDDGPAAKRDTKSIFGDKSSLMKELSENYQITCVCLGIYGQAWLRLSANVYNTIEDYIAIRDAILDLKSKEDS